MLRSIIALALASGVILAGSNLSEDIKEPIRNMVWIEGTNPVAADTDWVISQENMYSGVSGNVGIGTTTPSAKLHSSGSGVSQLRLEDPNVRLWSFDVMGNGDFRITDETATLEVIRFKKGTADVEFTGNSIRKGGSTVYRTSGGTARGWIKAHPAYDCLDFVGEGASLDFDINDSENWQMSIQNGEVIIHHDLTVQGNKNFVQPHPIDPNKEIVYTSLEGGEAGTYCRGTAQLINGMAIVNLPEHFTLVTADKKLTVQLTPLGECKGLYVESKTTSRIIVKELGNGCSNIKFDYFIQGIRKGYENKPIIRNKQATNHKSL